MGSEMCIRDRPTEEQFPAFVATIYIQTTLAMYAREVVSGAEKRREVATAVQAYFSKLKSSSLNLEAEQLVSDIEAYMSKPKFPAGWRWSGTTIYPQSATRMAMKREWMMKTLGR